MTPHPNDPDPCADARRWAATNRDASPSWSWKTPAVVVWCLAVAAWACWRLCAS